MTDIEITKRLDAQDAKITSQARTLADIRVTIGSLEDRIFTLESGPSTKPPLRNTGKVANEG